MRSVSRRLELAQRAAITVVLLVSVAAGIAFHLAIRFPLVRWRSGATGIAALLALALLLSALCRNRQLPVVSALVLTAAAAAGCVFADNILLGILLALGLSGAGYLTAQLFGFLLPMRWQPRIDAAAINATLLIGSISSVFVVAEILLWILSPPAGSLSSKPPLAGPVAPVPHPVVGVLRRERREELQHRSTVHRPSSVNSVDNALTVSLSARCSTTHRRESSPNAG